MRHKMTLGHFSKVLIRPVSGGQSVRAVRTETTAKSLYPRSLSQGDKVVISVLSNFLPLRQGEYHFVVRGWIVS